MGSTLRDWLLLFVSLVFTVAGIGIAVTKDDSTGIACAMFFGACTAIAVWQLRAKLRTRRNVREATRVEVPTGVPLLGSQTAGLVIAAGFVLVGTTMALTGERMGRTWMILSWVIAAAGALLLALTALGLTPRPYLVFEPRGLRFGQRRHAFLLEWDNIALITAGEMNGQALLAFMVRDTERVLATITADDLHKARERIARTMRWNRGMLGAELVVLPQRYGGDVVLFARAIARFIAPDRSELAMVKALLEPS